VIYFTANFSSVSFNTSQSVSQSINMHIYKATVVGKFTLK